MKTVIRFVCERCKREYDPFEIPSEVHMCGDCAFSKEAA